MIRKFKSGAIRDTADGKLEYYGFRHPLVEQSFAEYMNKHRVMSDGSLRSSNDWWGGWDKEISLQSMVRHMEDLQAINAGYSVFEIRSEDGSVHKEYTKEEPTFGKGDTLTYIRNEDCLNAIKFNCNAYLLQILDNNK